MRHEVLALVSQVEIEQDSDGFAEFTSHRHRCQVNIVTILRCPGRIEVRDTHETSVEIEEAHVEVLDHFWLSAADFLLRVPVSRKLILSVDGIWRPASIFIVVCLVVFWLAEVLKKLDSARPVAVVHLIDEHVAAQFSELVGVPNRLLPRSKVWHKDQVSIDLVWSKTFIWEANTLVIEQALLKAHNGSFETEDKELDHMMKFCIASAKCSV